MNCNVVCCISECGNARKSPGKLHFYKFPKESLYTPWRKRKRNLWIQSVREHVKINSDKKRSEWSPNGSTLICSAHFINGMKHENPLHPDYVPTIFPKKKNKKIQSIARFERHLRRTAKEIPHPPAIKPDIIENRAETFDRTREEEMDSTVPLLSQPHREIDVINEVSTPSISKETCSVECQTDILDTSNAFGMNYFFCSMRSDNGYNTAEVQINLPFIENQSRVPENNKKTRDIGCGSAESDIPVCSGFHGYGAAMKEEEVHALCGIGLENFDLLFNLLPEMKSRKLNKQNKLLIFLMKLRLGLPLTALAVLFGIHCTSVSRIFKSILECLAKSLSKYVFWPPKAMVQFNLPEAFKERYENCRVIIDCMELKMEKPSKVAGRVLDWSEYKHNHTIKILIGCTPNGFISFKSNCYGGKAGDCFIVNDSNFLDLLEPDDLVLADKGFPHIQVEVEQRKAIFVMPPFLTKEQFTADQVEETYKIASLRIHIERCIQRIRHFLILQLVSSELFPHIDDIMTTICALVNLSPPIIAEESTYWKIF